MDYSRYKDLKIRRLEPGILELVMGEEGGKLSTATAQLHKELAEIWVDIDRDPETRVAILRGAGKGFSAGGDLAMVEQITQDFAARATMPRSSGHSCAAWRRPSTTCCSASRCRARRRSGSASCPCAARRPSCRRRRWKSHASSPE